MEVSITYNAVNADDNTPVITLPLAKSISNRLVVIDSLAGNTPPRHTLSDCDDTNTIYDALYNPQDTTHCNVGSAGTAMRFLTALFAATPGKDIILHGDERMHRRPIAPLVNALQQLGADIQYLEHTGYPPLHIKGRILTGGATEIEGGVSSQFISALLMIASTMTLGMELTVKGHIVSRPYINMTIALMHQHGVEVEWRQPDSEETMLKVMPSTYHKTMSCAIAEADYSAASYFYEAAAITGRKVTLKGLRKNSLQGDCRVVEIFDRLGVKTLYNSDNSVTLEPGQQRVSMLTLDMTDCPDLVPAVVATCCSLSVPFTISGLQTLKIKETDRLAALQQELAKPGFSISILNDSVITCDGNKIEKRNGVTFLTYNDHRMAMSLAPLAKPLHRVTIDNPEVVTKSYPLYWNHLELLGYALDYNTPFKISNPLTHEQS